jgi:hypothetical protein
MPVENWRERERERESEGEREQETIHIQYQVVNINSLSGFNITPSIFCLWLVGF